MPYSVVPKILSQHPMLARINEALVSGQTSRGIAAWTVPPVSHSVIARYKTQFVSPILDNAVELKRLLRPHNDVIPINSSVGTAEMTVPVRQHTPEKMALKVLSGLDLLSVRENRIKAQQDRHRKLQSVMEARGSDTAMAEVPGGQTGLLIQRHKKFGTEYEIDTALLSEFREHEKLIAIELGQWQETQAGAVAIQIICPVSPDPAAPPRVSFSEGAEVFEEIGTLQKP